MSEFTSENINKCNNCQITSSEKKLSKCSRCNKVYYCSRDCQKEDWNEHKKRCVDKKNKISETEQEQEDQQEEEFKFINKITLLDIFDKVIDSCCSKTLYEKAFKSYLLLEIENGKDINFIKECLLNDEIKPKLAKKGIIYYLKNNLKDRYFCTKVVNTLIELIKNINSNIPNKESQEIADSFFKYIEKDNIDYDSFFTISAYEMNVRNIKAIIFRCSS
jgi:hypothetical protein